MFSDGSTVVLADDEVVRLCDALWLRSSTPGAVAIVGMLEHERRRSAAGRNEIRLNDRETAIFLEEGAVDTPERVEPSDAAP
ncbi:MAG: hypothetical protein ACXVHQ_40650 [Solirubrobacteraceae bacterium]